MALVGSSLVNPDSQRGRTPRNTKEATTVLPGRTRTPAQIIGELLNRHPEAASLQSEASHRRALACGAAARAGRAFAAAQASRLAYEELRHQLDPRRLRTVNFAAGLLVLTLLGAGLTVLLALLLAAVHGGDPGSVPFGLLISGFILVLAVSGAALMARMESAALLVARRRWHRARAAHQAALQIERDDNEAATVATEAWLGLVRTSAVTEAGVADETVALAVVLLDIGRPELTSS